MRTPHARAFFRSNRPHSGLALALTLAAACGPVGGSGDGGRDASATACRSDRECAGLVCDRGAGPSVECVTASDCLGSDRACVRNACIAVVPCTSSRMCPGQVCDRVRSVCVDCVTDDDCPTEQQCRESFCAARPRPCMSSRECSAQAQVCDPSQGFCVDCVGPEDCAADEQCTANRCARAASTPPDAGPPADAPAPVDTFVPPPDAREMDAFVPPPDVPAPVDTFTPPPDAPRPDVPPSDAPAPAGSNDTCPGAAIESDVNTSFSWSGVRAGADVGTSCGSRMRPGTAYRDVIYRFTTNRPDEVGFSVGSLPVGAAFELQTDCGTPVPGSCTYRDMPTGGYGSLFNTVPAGTYQFVLEVPEGSGATTSSALLRYATYIAPSTWTYARTTPTGVAFVDACSEPGARTDLANVDDRGAAFDPPFLVQVFDVTDRAVTSSRLFVTTNGWLAVGHTRGIMTTPPITNSLNADGLISPLSMDLITTSRGVCAVTRGAAPNRRYVVQWDHVRQYGGSGSSSGDVHMQAIIHEAAAGTPNVVDFVYDRVEGLTRPYVVGLRGTYQDGVSVATVTGPSAMRFTPMRR